MQAAVDGPTVARMWQFLRDAHFIDSSSQHLTFRLAVLNPRSQTVGFWIMHLAMLPSGRLQSVATVIDAPILWSEGVTLQDLLKFSTSGIIVLFTLAHTAFVSGLHPDRFLQLALPETSDTDAELTHRSSDWFRRICQLSCIGLVSTMIVGLHVNASVLRQVNNFSITNSTDSISSQFLPANIYHDVLAPARMLMPAKEVPESVGDGVCNVVSDGIGQSTVDIRVDHNEGRIWAQQDASNGALKNYSSLLACSCAARPLEVATHIISFLT